MNSLDWKKPPRKRKEWFADHPAHGRFTIRLPYPGAKSWTILRDGSVWTGTFASAANAMRFVERYTVDHEVA